MKPLTFIFVFSICYMLKAQIGIGTTNPHTSSILHIESSTKGFLPPRLTLNQRNSILNPAEGLMIYCYDCCPGNSNDGGVVSYFTDKWENMPACTPDGGIIVREDWDNDGIPNDIDIDDDNDGILDTLETWTITRLTQQLGFDMSSFIHESGQDKKTGAVYRYSNVQPGLDIKVRIVNITGPVSIKEIDKPSSGEMENFNPVITYHGSGNDEGKVDLKFEFVEAGTNTPRIIPQFLFSPRDVDGSGSSSQMGEFQIVKNPNEVILDGNTTLTLIKQGQDYRIEGNPSITNPGIGPQKEFLTSTFFTKRTFVEVSLGVQKKTSGSQTHDRLFSITTQTNVIKKYDPPVLTSGYQDLTRDSDNDGSPDQFDLDSDEDGCSDAFEGNLTQNKRALFQFPLGEVGRNGLYDVLETFPDSGILKRKPDAEEPYNPLIHSCND